MHLAPIVLFVYNRPWHTEQTLRALQQNDLANESALCIYADGPKQNASNEELRKIEEVRKLIRKELWCREVQIIESGINKGLADSVIDGVTEIVNRYGKIIVLEDDLVTAKGFLKYMNTALEKFENADQVMQVSGYIFPLQIKARSDSFFLPMATSWGWATWKRAWAFFDPMAKGYEKLKSDSILASQFDLNDAYSYSSMLISQMEEKKISSWAIRWWWGIFNKNGLTLFPDASLVKNIGFGSEGTHTRGADPFLLTAFNSNYFISNFPTQLKINKEIFKRITSYLMKSNSNNRGTSKLENGIEIIKKLLLAKSKQRISS